MRRYKSACHLQRFLSVHDQVANQFMRCRYNHDAKQKWELRAKAFAAWNAVTCAKMVAVSLVESRSARKFRPFADNLTVPLEHFELNCGKS